MAKEEAIALISMDRMREDNDNKNLAATTATNNKRGGNGTAVAPAGRFVQVEVLPVSMPVVVLLLPLLARR